jgi:hypothetical protein
MKNTYVNVVADSETAPAGPDSKTLRTVYRWVRMHNKSVSKRRAQLRFDQAADATWIKKRETVARILKQFGPDGG